VGRKAVRGFEAPLEGLSTESCTGSGDNRRLTFYEQCAGQSQEQVGRLHRLQLASRGQLLERRILGAPVNFKGLPPKTALRWSSVDSALRTSDAKLFGALSSTLLSSRSASTHRTALERFGWTAPARAAQAGPVDTRR
jgi:hypothetical protein